MTNIEKSILSTIVYHNTINLSLTSWEIFEYLLLPMPLRSGNEDEELSFSDILVALDGDCLRSFVEEKKGFYFLRGRSFLYDKRVECQKISDIKWKKLIKIVRWFGAIPFIKIIFANGSLTLNNTDKESDLDVLIVAKKWRIWTVRFFLALITALMGVKRFNKSQNVNNKICFNHFVTDKSMYIPFHSIYTANIFSSLELIMDNQKYKNKFRNGLCDFYDNNQWIKEYLPNFSSKKNNQRLIKGRFIFIGKFCEWLLSGWMGNLLEDVLKKYQLRRIDKNINNGDANLRGRIILSDDQLEFHLHSLEGTLIDCYNNKMIELGFSEFASEGNSGIL